MDEACMNAIIGTLLIVDSFVEADDLQDAFERHRLGPVVHMRTVETARAMLEETARRPQILVIGAAAGSATFRGSSSTPARSKSRGPQPTYCPSSPLTRTGLPLKWKRDALTAWILESGHSGAPLPA